jgi:hypothetical protein
VLAEKKATVPEPTVTITFDRQRCSVEPTPLPPVTRSSHTTTRPSRRRGRPAPARREDTYEELRGLVGPGGSVVPPVEEPPKGLETVAFVEELAGATTTPSTLVAACLQGAGADGSVRIWLSDRSGRRATVATTA